MITFSVGPLEDARCKLYVAKLCLDGHLNKLRRLGPLPPLHSTPNYSAYLHNTRGNPYIKPPFFVLRLAMLTWAATWYRRPK